MAYYVFFFNLPATTEIYTLSLHDALPILKDIFGPLGATEAAGVLLESESRLFTAAVQDRKSTRLNSSHANISYAVFCLKKKTKTNDAFNEKKCDKIMATLVKTTERDQLHV